MLRETLSYLVFCSCLKFVAAGTAIIITSIKILVSNPILGVLVLVCLGILVSLMCALPIETYSMDLKDDVYDCMMDIFQNLDFIGTTQHGISVAVHEILLRAKKLYSAQMQSIHTSNRNYIIGHAITTLLYGICVIYLYKLYNRGTLPSAQFITDVIVLEKLFIVIYNLFIHVPTFRKTLVTLDQLNPFINDLFRYKSGDSLAIQPCDIQPCDIVLNNVTVEFQAIPILQNISLTIPSGSMIALYGVSGSGKTTLLRLIQNTLQPTAGTISIGPHSIATLSRITIRQYIGSLVQNTTALLQMSIYANIIYGYEDSNELRKQVENLVVKYDLVSVFGTIHFLDRFHRLSYAFQYSFFLIRVKIMVA